MADTVFRSNRSRAAPQGMAVGCLTAGTEILALTFGATVDDPSSTRCSPHHSRSVQGWLIICAQARSHINKQCAP